VVPSPAIFAISSGYVEAVRTPGGKGLQLTGQLGEVMTEPAQTAFSWLWSQAGALQLDPAPFREGGIHIHVPAGAIPKGGPSAGVTMATSLMSLLSGRPVRGDTATTGEITLAGLVLPVGGIREKAPTKPKDGYAARAILPRPERRGLSRTGVSPSNWNSPSEKLQRKPGAPLSHGGGR